MADGIACVLPLVIGIGLYDEIDGQYRSAEVSRSVSGLGVEYPHPLGGLRQDGFQTRASILGYINKKWVSRCQ